MKYPLDDWTLDLRFLAPKDAELVLQLFWSLRDLEERRTPMLPKVTPPAWLS